MRDLMEIRSKPMAADIQFPTPDSRLVPKTVGDEMRKLSLSDAIAKGEAVVHHGMSSHEKASPNTE